ncbi:MAG: lipid-A-disaccharide synthase [Gammaproteobacteria bacterium]|nr:lipid-A-disaccharide synthase [Gammaproteobacteria bacterium]
MQSQPKHIVIIAGEESGDQHAATFIQTLKQRQPHLKITGIGGQHMQDAGVELISDLARHGVTGISEVLLHVRVIRNAFKKIKAHLDTTKPDLLVLVDYPGFNLRLARYAKTVLNMRIVYYISPQIWAWKANRIHTIRRYIDKMAVILPFEKKLYEEAGVPVSFVGHPMVEHLNIQESPAALKQQLNIPENKTILAILPGSRRNEIKRLMPILREAAIYLTQRHPELHIVIPVARSLQKAQIATFFESTSLPLTLIEEQAISTVYCSDFVIVASGTASLECALLTKPMCIIYKTSLITFVAACHFMRVKYLGLCNLLQSKMIVPELMQYDCTANDITELMSDLMTDEAKANRMVSRLQRLKQSLSHQDAEMSIAELIETELQATEISHDHSH